MAMLDRRLFLFASAAAFYPRPSLADKLSTPTNKPILTISGNIRAFNGDGLAQFDLGMLETLGLSGFTTKTPWYDEPVAFEGVSMMRLTEAVDGFGENVVATALNDYETTIPIADFAEFNVLLALKRNGKYMPISDKGPLFIVYPYDSNQTLRTQKYIQSIRLAIAYAAIYMNEQKRGITVSLPIAPVAFKLFFMAVTAILIVASLYSSRLMVQRQDSLRAVSRYNSTWLLMQAAQEVSRLELAVGRILINGTENDQERGQLWFDIVSNRVHLLDGGEVRDFLATNPPFARIAEELRDLINSTPPMSELVGRPDRLKIFMDRLAGLNPNLMRLASAAYARSGELAAADLEQLSHLHWLLSGVLGALIFCSAMLISVMSWHNKLLIRAHSDVHNLVDDLKRTSGELTEANIRVLRAMDDVKVQNARFDAALNNMSQALCMVDSGQHLIVCNVRFLELFGVTADLAAPGTPMADVFRTINANSQFADMLIDAVRIEQQALVFGHRSGRFQRESPDGAALAVWHQPMAEGGWVATYEDVTERQRAAAKIYFMAHHDTLTGLPNRVLFNERMEALIKRAHVTGEQVAVLCLDLDYFKNVNDTLGHSTGDALLQAVAVRLRQCVRTEDLIARLGGDEFAILQAAVDYPAQVEHLAQRIVQVLCEPYEVEGKLTIIGVSVGIASGNTDLNGTELLKNADVALYRAKGDGRGTYRFFEAGMAQELQNRRFLEARAAGGARQRAIPTLLSARLRSGVRSRNRV